MYERRLRGYRAMGYAIRDSAIEPGLNVNTDETLRNKPRTRT